MVVSTGSYIVNDTMMKLATAGLPPYEVLFLRGAAATLWAFRCCSCWAMASRSR